MKTGHDERTRHLSRWVVAGMILVSVAYLWMLGCRGKEREADLLVLYTSGPDRPAPVHPETSIPLWASPEQVQAEVERIRQHRAEQDLPTVVVSARPDTNTARVVDVGGHRVLVLEISGAERSFAVAREALVSGLQGPPADLTVVATSLPAGDVWDHLSGPLAVLPGGYSADVPEGVEVKAEGRLVAPWVDSRYRLGELRVDFDQPLALEGRAVELRSGAARPDGDTLIGVGSDALSYDAIHFHQGGLGKVIAQQMVERTGADLALVNYLSVRHDLVGPVDIVRLQAALPFHNQVELLTLTGAQILALLQHIAHLEGQIKRTESAIAQAKEALSIVRNRNENGLFRQLEI